tara:strand:- start:809 stop:961 length:153 start_codon:yes stop_codon:yes gene_type:complete
MAEKQKTPVKAPSIARGERLKAALKANMSRRKAQARARAQNSDQKETKDD